MIGLGAKCRRENTNSSAAMLKGTIPEATCMCISYVPGMLVLANVCLAVCDSTGFVSLGDHESARVLGVIDADGKNGFIRHTFQTCG